MIRLSRIDLIYNFSVITLLLTVIALIGINALFTVLAAFVGVFALVFIEMGVFWICIKTLGLCFFLTIASTISLFFLPKTRKKKIDRSINKHLYSDLVLN